MVWRDCDDVNQNLIVPPKEAAQALAELKRRAKARFLADENFTPRAIDIIRAKGGKVQTARGSGLSGMPDEAYCSYALKRRLMLVTLDRDYLNNAKFPLMSCPAIFVFDFGTGSDAEILSACLCLWQPFHQPNFFDKWVKFDATPTGWAEIYRFLDGTTARSRFRVHRGKRQEWCG